MDSRRFPYAFIAVSIIIMLLITGSEARSEIYDPKCPGICSPGIVPDCNKLCVGLGFPAGGYCKKLTCCCKPKSSKPPNISYP
ncbi:hypothetical protein EUTSA_v10005212mg [Eutrema salsugineum]|uniref:Knottin scorpion toxin-like domain-containing protein n=1 Tax=Eutrema salsugineum TaxID=72664 RepID=V4KQX3_EUTSA|nr:hypothetical protein EUTSA_v10005212mg [Eutrema salsugineum]